MTGGKGRTQTIFKKTYPKGTDEVDLPRIVGCKLKIPGDRLNNTAVTESTNITTAIVEGGIEYTIVGAFREQ